MTDSAMEYKFLSPEELPEDPTALDAWILQGKEIILSKKHDEEDQIINLTFEGFKQSIHDVFGQSITIEVQDFNQCLVLRKGNFAFVRMDTTETYLARNNQALNPVSTLLSQRLAQELNFLNQLNTFQAMQRMFSLHPQPLFKPQQILALSETP